MSQEPTVKDLVDFVKQRIIEDFETGADQLCTSMWDMRSTAFRKHLQDLIKTLELLALPGTIKTLDIYYKKGFWKGWDEPLFVRGGSPAPRSKALCQALCRQSGKKRSKKR
jgi:hypothetical protein